MNPAAPQAQPAPDAAFAARVCKARHDLNNTFGQVLGFAEMLLEEVQEPASEKLRPGLELVYQTAKQLVALNNEVLNARRADIPHHELREFNRTVHEQSHQMAAAARQRRQEIAQAEGRRLPQRPHSHRGRRPQAMEITPRLLMPSTGETQ